MEDPEDLLRSAVSPAYWAACTAHLAAVGRGAANQPNQRALLALQQLLQADLNKCGAPRLPQGVQDLHNTMLHGKFLLQADEGLNIGAAVRERYSGNDGNGRCLKLLLTDGVQQVAALEYRPIPALRSTMPAGAKLLVRDVPVRRGMLLLTPQNCSVLGGSVPALEAARQRMVAHWVQPAVGRRGPPPGIQQATAEATRAAWADEAVAVGEQLRPPQQQMVQPSAQQHQQQPAAQGQPLQQPTQLLSQQQPAAQGQPLQQPTQLRSQQQPAAQGQPLQQPASGPGSGRMRPPGLQPAAGGAAYPSLQLRPQAGVQAPPAQQHTGSGRAASPPGPLQELNGAPSSGANKRSRLALPRLTPAAAASQAAAPQEQPQHPHASPAAAAPAPADFSFAQPLQRALGAPPHAPHRMQAHVQPELLRRLRESAAASAGAGLAAGTDEDPICLDDDDQRAGCVRQHAQPDGSGTIAGRAAGAEGKADAPASADADVEMADAEHPTDGGGWHGGDEGWEDQPAGGHVDPWEQGYEDAMPPGDEGAGWQEGDDAGWEDGDGVDSGQVADEGEPVGSAEEPQQQPKLQEMGSAAGPEPAAPAEAGGEDGWDDEEAAQPGGQQQRQRQQQQQQGTEGEAVEAPLIAAACAAPAATQHHSQSRSSAGAPLQQPQQPAQPSEGSSQRRLSGRRPASAKQQQPAVMVAGAADDAASAKSATIGFQLAAAAPRTVTKPAAAGGRKQGGSYAGLGLPGVPELEPLDPELLEAAPTLAEVLFAKQGAGPGLQEPAAAAPAAAGPAAAVAGALEAAAFAAAGGGPPLGRSASRSARSSPPLLQQPGRARTASSAQPVTALQAALPPRPAPPWQPAAPLPTARHEPAVAGDSDEDLPSFGLLGDLSPQKQQSSAPASSTDEPFIYLLHLAARASNAGAAAFPLCARILATVKTFVGKLQFRDPQTGAAQYGMEMLVEDGSLVARTRLDHGFIARLFEMEPPEFEACLADPTRRVHAAELVKGLQQLMASYSGLMEVRLPGAGQRLEVTNLLGDMTGAQAEAFQRRATGCAG